MRKPFTKIDYSKCPLNNLFKSKTIILNLAIKSLHRFITWAQWCSFGCVWRSAVLYPSLENSNLVDRRNCCPNHIMSVFKPCQSQLSNWVLPMLRARSSCAALGTETRSQARPNRWIVSSFLATSGSSPHVLFRSGFSVASRRKPSAPSGLAVEVALVLRVVRASSNQTVALS